MIAATLKPPPEKFGVTHWSSRLLAGQLGSPTSRSRRSGASRGAAVAARAFKFSTDPELEAKVLDVVGLYLDPPEKAVVLVVDEKSQIQALDRTAPVLPTAAAPDRTTHPRLHPPRHHDPVRRPGGRHRQGHRRAATAAPAQEFLASSSRSPRPTPASELHLVMDNYATHKHPKVQAWLATNPRIHALHPDHGSWLNLVESCSPHRARRSAAAPTSASRPHRHDRRLHRRLERTRPPFIWTKTARPDPDQGQP